LSYFLPSCPLPLSPFQIFYNLYISLTLYLLSSFTSAKLLSYFLLFESPPSFSSYSHSSYYTVFIFFSLFFFPFRTASLSFSSLSFLSLTPCASLLLVFPLHLFSLMFPFRTLLSSRMLYITLYVPRSCMRSIMRVAGKFSSFFFSFCIRLAATRVQSACGRRQLGYNLYATGRQSHDIFACDWRPVVCKVARLLKARCQKNYLN
jgi:hypothetical protein